MQHEINSKPDFACLTVRLEQGEQIITEAGAMVAMSNQLDLSTNMKGGLLGAAKRAIGGESLFMNTYTAQGNGQQLQLAPSTPGDIEHVRMTSNGVMLQSGSYLCSTPEVEVDTKWTGAKSFFGGEGLFMLRCSGSGDLWMSSYGAIHTVEVQGGYIVDTGHIVAFDDSLTYKVRPVAGMKSLFFSSEGLICEFSGHGRLWLQTRNSSSLAAFLHPFRAVKPPPSNDN